MKAKEGFANVLEGSQLTIFPNSSHMPFREERDSFMKRVGRFLAQAERES